MSTFLSCFTSSVQEQIDTESPRREQEQTPDKEQQQQQDTKQQNQNIQVSKELPDPRSIIQLLYANAKAGGSLPDNEDKRLFNQQGAKLTFGEIADVQVQILVF